MKSTILIVDSTTGGYAGDHPVPPPQLLSKVADLLRAWVLDVLPAELLSISENSLTLWQPRI